MTREFKLPPDAFSARTERGSAKGLMRVEAVSAPENVAACLPSVRSASVEGIAMVRDLTVRDIREMIREEIAEDRDRREVDALYASRPGPVCQPMPDGTIKMFS